MAKLTPKQQRLVDGIAAFEAKFMRRPTHDEMAGIIGVRAKSTINAYLDRIERAGGLRRRYDHPLTVQPLD